MTRGAADIQVGDNARNQEYYEQYDKHSNDIDDFELRNKTYDINDRGKAEDGKEDGKKDHTGLILGLTLGLGLPVILLVILFSFKTNRTKFMNYISR